MQVYDIVRTFTFLGKMLLARRSFLRQALLLSRRFIPHLEAGRPVSSPLHHMVWAGLVGAGGGEECHGGVPCAVRALCEK